MIVMITQHQAIYHSKKFNHLVGGLMKGQQYWHNKFSKVEASDLYLKVMCVTENYEILNQFKI